jgi:hypothetical protein
MMKRPSSTLADEMGHLLRISAVANVVNAARCAPNIFQNATLALGNWVSAQVGSHALMTSFSTNPCALFGLLLVATAAVACG